MAKENPTFNANDKENFTTALSSLLSAISSDRDAFCQLVTTNTALAQQLADTQQRLSTLEASSHNQRNQGNQNRNTNKNYCWTHGFRVAADQDSANCRNKAEGHQDKATRTLAGCQRSKTKAEF
jgi:hypothetical protein